MPDPAVWSIEANGADEVVETYGYLTDLLPGYDEREQRVSLRAVPVESLEFSVLCTDAREAGLFESLLYGLQDETLVVPLWQYGRRLTSAVSIGTSTFFVDGDPRDDAYRIGGYLVAWLDPFTYELFTVSGVFSNSVTTSDNAGANWPVGTLVFPARLSRVASRVGPRWVDVGVLSARPVFTSETAEATTAAAESYPLYRSLPVLTVVPDRADGAPDDVERGVLVLDSKTGARAADARSTAPQVVRAFAWWNASRAEVKALREFVNNRRGRARPFWAPSWEQDFALASDHAPGASVLVVRARDYAARVFPAGQGRRHLAVRTSAGVSYYRHVESAVDNLNGTESLTLDLAVPDALPAAGSLVSSLRFCRLDTDEPRFEWSGGEFATCSLPVRELPSEAPA